MKWRRISECLEFSVAFDDTIIFMGLFDVFEDKMRLLLMSYLEDHWHQQMHFMFRFFYFFPVTINFWLCKKIPRIPDQYFFNRYWNPLRICTFPVKWKRLKIHVQHGNLMPNIVGNWCWPECLTPLILNSICQYATLCHVKT